MLLVGGAVVGTIDVPDPIGQRGRLGGPRRPTR
jgi:hypothetical protein